MQKEITYFTVLIGAILIGHFVQKVDHSSHRKWLCSILGFIIVFIVSGSHIYYCILCVFLNYLVILLVPRKLCSCSSFILSFTFLIFFRTCTYFHLYSPPDTNAVQMIITIKMIGLAYEIQTQADASNSYLKDGISFANIYHYAFCYTGILIGPYFKYSTYMDMIHCPYKSSIDYMKHLKQRLKYCPLYLISFVVGSKIFPHSFLASHNLLEQPILWKIGYMFAVFFVFRMKMYFGFVMGECVCIMSGLGCYPKMFNSVSGSGPKNYADFVNWKKESVDNNNKNQLEKNNVEYDFETIRNVNEYACEYSKNLQGSIRNWNMTIQYFLFIVVYKQFPIAPLKVFITMMTSAIWHGLNPGYFLSLLMVPFILLSQKQTESAIRSRLSLHHQLLYDWISWAYTMAIFAYIMVPFLLLDTAATFAFYKSIYFIGHLIVCSVIFTTYFIKLKQL